MLRISTVNGPVVLADSEQLYYSARYGGAEQCTPACLPGCADHGWLNLVAGGSDTRQFGHQPGSGEFSAVPLKIEIRPVMLAGR